MKVKILGAGENVTGSKFLVETEEKRFLIDCGLFQEREFKNRNWENLPISPESIDFIILTHAHIDHCGYLPKIVKDGFKGEIYCTQPTEEIAKIALLDSGKLQEEDAKKKKERHEKEGRKGPFPEIPLYTIGDVEKVFPLFRPKRYKEEIKISDKIIFTFYDAGHILGSSMVELKIKEGREKKKIIFSGDIGRRRKVILEDPTIFQESDFVFMESTYGDRLHDDEKNAEEKLKNVVNETVKKGGNVVIPTFAIERAQELLYFLRKLLIEDKIPHILVFVDSPMAMNITNIFKKYIDYFDNETKKMIKEGNSPFNFPLLKFTKTINESKAINYIRGSSIIMAGSGMCTGGRIKHHLITNITRKESTILFVGYQAKGTLGREIIDKKKNVRILGQFYPVKANIEKINGFSAHADRDELFFWISKIKNIKNLFLIHGEKEVINSFSAFLKKRLSIPIYIPQYLEEITI